jgi:O-antigen ligase
MEPALGRFFIVTLSALVLSIFILLFGGEISILYLIAYCIAILILMDFKKGVLFAVLLLPFADTNLIPRSILGIMGLNPLNVVLVFTVFSMLVANINRNCNYFLPLPYPLLLYIILIISGALVGSFHAEQGIVVKDFRITEFYTVKKYLLEELIKPFFIIIVAWLVGTSILNADSRIKEGQIYIWVLAFVPVIYFLVVVNFLLFSGIEFSVLASSRARDFLSWIGMHANELGLMSNMFLALMLCSALSCENKSSRVYFFIAASAAGITSALTFSRGAFLGIFLIGVYYFWRCRKIKQLIIGLFIIAAIIFILPDPFWERAFTGIETRDADSITAGRLDRIWRPLWSVFLQSPMTGHGLSSTLWTPHMLYGRMLLVGHPHNAYLGVLLDFGLLGFGVIGLFFWSMWRLFRELCSNHPDNFWRGVFEGGSLCILILLVQAVTDDRFVPTYQHVTLWIIYGVALAHKTKLSIRLH